MAKFPSDVLRQHVAVLGKTGSGKTSTAKLAVEHVVADGGRVCVLDPIKSDWWGLTSSASGKRAGLPFQILGGPRGHVPLHSAAGKAIGEVVANASLPLSIIDMADFEPGGHSKFFADFAASLMRSMSGVLHLVVEEAHEFAPKERSGAGNENMAIHWAKKLAVAGRSKGIRLLLATQRTQSLHNSLLGSCDTVIVHRLTLPADQAPVNKWLAANVDKATAAKVEESLSRLPTGCGWVCSGEEQIFKRQQFDRIKTYDNTATPTDAYGEAARVKTAEVDADRLTAIIGEAVEVAEANDPKKLRQKIASLEKQLAKATPVVDDEAIASAVADRDRHWRTEVAKIEKARDTLAGRIAKAAQLLHVNGEASVKVEAPPLAKGSAAGTVDRRADPPAQATKLPSGRIGKTEHNVLRALFWMKDDASQDSAKLAFLAGYSPKSSTVGASLTLLRQAGLVDGRALTAEGERLIAETVGPKPTGPELREWLRGKVGIVENKVLDYLCEHRGDRFGSAEIAEAIGYSPTASTVGAALTKLRKYEAIEGGGRQGVKAAAVFFEQ